MTESVNVRQRQILSWIERGENVRVAELAGMFSVSEMTIRRDLTGLENMGKLLRTHGGAALPAVPDMGTMAERVSQMKNTKLSMARAAASLVNEGHRIFLGMGSSIMAVAHQLANGPDSHALTTVPDIATAFVSAGRNTVELTGGTLDPVSRGLGGERVVEAISKCFFDVAFVSAHSFSPEYGLVDSSDLQRTLQPILARQSRCYVVLADHSKLNRPGHHISLDWRSVDVFVTDTRPGEDLLKVLSDAQVELIVGEQFENMALPEKYQLIEERL
ncbi:DeoR/GlpR family DNA-binding transcription regulator [Paraburkholderia aspalathi]|uniref:Transcriptional regulator, DeoR family n=1 Tax=Paraburkholderia aspalathi TaxID=1324617 RepID=A0A1I7B8S3_9BURK|nr:DeoR/GlpR family DNA-binding transcription regulator [Paraburkholderia aspalathi]SFT83538.1 transcriptional regulator, DeoR family [Paraburkholderia aspalathi]